MRGADRTTAALLLLFAGAFSAGALRHYRYWDDTGPGSAFLPFWIGVTMAALALVMLLRRPRESREVFPAAEGARRVLAVIVITVAFVALLKPLGMVVSTVLYLVAMIRLLGRRSWGSTAAVAGAVAAANYVLFVHWLRVPFPVGVLGF